MDQRLLLTFKIKIMVHVTDFTHYIKYIKHKNFLLSKKKKLKVSTNKISYTK